MYEAAQFRSQFLMIDPHPLSMFIYLCEAKQTLFSLYSYGYISIQHLFQRLTIRSIKNKCMNLILFASQSKRSLLDYMFMMYDLWLLKFQILFSDVKISGQAASKLIELLSDRCNCKGPTEEPKCKGKSINNYHWSTVAGSFLLGTRSVAFSTNILIRVTRPL